MKKEGVDSENLSGKAKLAGISDAVQRHAFSIMLPLLQHLTPGRLKFLFQNLVQVPAQLPISVPDSCASWDAGGASNP